MSINRLDKDVVPHKIIAWCVEEDELYEPSTHIGYRETEEEAKTLGHFWAENQAFYLEKLEEELEYDSRFDLSSIILTPVYVPV